MRRALLPLGLLLLGGCSVDGRPAEEPKSPCRSERFEQSSFIVCAATDPHKLELRAAGEDEAAVRRFQDLGLSEKGVAFAMNAGMFDEAGRPIGLAVVDGKQVHKIALKPGGGNFGMKPNGVFLVDRTGRADIVVSEDYDPSANIRLATQSGPMLVIDGKLHPKFAPDGESRNMRNGVGVGADGSALFVISEDPVSLGKMARFFRDGLKTRDALYFDGSVSSLWSPADHRLDDFTELGPIIVAKK